MMELDTQDLFIYYRQFGVEKYDFIYNRIRYLLGVKSGTIYVVAYNYAKIKIDLYDSLPLEITITFYDVIILSKSVFNSDKNNY